ncbi:hypothetical protein BSKO_09042 [Bryopsis sp. KO-2023]|nr:hypothetical protein BSKO_09042 [Bryopsis sp. KO-2023]
MGLHIPRCYTILFWVFCLVIGLVVGSVAVSANFIVGFLFKEVYSLFVFRLVDTTMVRVYDILIPCLYNVATVLLGSALVLFIAPIAAGSGQPNMYAYLNGVEMPGFLTLKVAVVKLVASVLVVSGGLVIGKEGPLLHIGAIVATFLGGSRVFRSLGQRREQDPFTYEQHARDLVACGTAAGLAAGFKAPVGGMLLAYEMASRWRPELTWRTLFTCAVVAAVVRGGSALSVDKGTLSYGSLLFFRNEVDFPTPIQEVHWVALLGAIGGVVGSLFTTLNMYLGSKRWRFKLNIPLRLLEAASVTLLTTGLRISLPFLGTCLEKTDHCQGEEHCLAAPGVEELQAFGFYGCHNGTYNDLAVLLNNPQGFVVKSLFTEGPHAFHGVSLVIFCVFYFSMSVVTYGMAIPAGLFTPSVITGGALGRVYADAVNRAFGVKLDPGLYAFLGSGAVLGGLYRFAVSFVVILTELTNTEEQLPLLMLVVIIAKGVGDRFNQNILNHLCVLSGLPYVGGHPESTIKRKGFEAKDVMTRTMTTLDLRERREVIDRALELDETEVFPVVERTGWTVIAFRGLVYAQDLRELLASVDDAENGGVSERAEIDDEKTRLLGENASRLLGSHPPVINEEGEDLIDLSGITKLPPVVIPPDMSLTSIYRLKNSTGLEYIPVVSNFGPLKGMITRDLLVQCQNTLIDPYHVEDRLEKLTLEPYLDRVSYENWLSGVDSLPVMKTAKSFTVAANRQRQPSRRLLRRTTTIA